MKIALIGYGRMGREVEGILVAKGHIVVGIFDEDNPLTVSGLCASDAELAIEFTVPEAAFENIAMCLEARVAVVSGTTGWLTRWDEAVALCRKFDGAMFYASNYSVGVNLFCRLNEQLARMMNGFPQYGAAISETHHIHKKDAPSGTAITIAEGIIAKSERYDGWELPEVCNDVAEDKIRVEAIREGEVPGTHTVRWQSDVDMITITHEAFNRRGLAAGVVMAAEFLYGRKGIFSMRDLLGGL
jgi:4-hydroxy-tetrahydrodipicolinate reductase